MSGPLEMGCVRLRPRSYFEDFISKGVQLRGTTAFSKLMKGGTVYVSQIYALTC